MAFYRCTILASVHMPRALRLMGARAFADCFALQSVSLPVMLRKIGEHAFDNCTSLTTVIMPDHKVSVAHAVFDRCSAMEVLVLSDSVRSIIRKCERWHVQVDVHIVLHSELKIALMFSEFAKADPERRAALRGQIRRLIHRLKRRNHLSSAADLRTTLSSAVQAIGEQVTSGDGTAAYIPDDIRAAMSGGEETNVTNEGDTTDTESKA